MRLKAASNATVKWAGHITVQADRFPGSRIDRIILIQESVQHVILKKYDFEGFQQYGVDSYTRR